MLQRHHPCVDRHGRRGHHALLVSVYQSVELTRPASKARPAVIVIETRPRRTRGEHEPRGAFKFKLCPFGAFMQDDKTLGTFQGWLPMPKGGVEFARGRDALIYEQEVMGFNGGDPCDGTPRRAIVYFECAAQDALTEVSEPQTCVYVGWFKTPSACDGAELRRRHEALVALRG